jgi:eukaryotic-like serine/threonine-protein kinase
VGCRGAGGMGEVYRVRDRELDEVVALKLIPQQSTTELRSTERLRREVRLARRISSQFVCRIFDIVDLGEGARGLTMALVEGTTLAEMMRKAVPVDYLRFARWGADIAEGLDAAHELNVIHRDLKPENVMIRSDDRAVILDFGIAYSAETGDQTLKLTQAGMIMGTPLYMSPEQLLNLSLDGRSDLFALGLILAELITGEVPMRGNGYNELVEKRITKPEPYRIRNIDPAVPEPLAKIIDSLLATASADRPQRARDVAVMLRDFAEGRSVAPTAPIAPATAPIAAPSSPKTTYVALAVAAIVFLVLAFLVARPRKDIPAVVPSPAPMPVAAPDASVPDASVPVAPDAGLRRKPRALPPAEEM